MKLPKLRRPRAADRPLEYVPHEARSAAAASIGSERDVPRPAHLSVR